jgi:hypothetical protein
MHKFNMRFVFHFYILELTAWIRTNCSSGGLKFENPSKWNSYEGFNLEHWTSCEAALLLTAYKAFGLPQGCGNNSFICFIFILKR